jgi:polar amino acid transport system ATP-binding protein
MNLDIQNLDKSFGATKVFQNLNLSSSVQVLALIGPSGSGKSTLLRMIAGLDIASSGEMRLNDKVIPQAEGFDLENYRKNLGIVFQSWNLFPHLSAFDNIILPLKICHKYLEADAKKIANELLERFDLQKHAHKKPSELSGGQNQRVAILRAVAHKPSVILLDEPTSALDPVMTAEVLDLINEIKKENTSFIIVSHHIPFMKKISDKIVFMSEGKILEHTNTSEFFTHPTSPQVQEYLKTVLKYN